MTHEQKKRQACQATDKPTSTNCSNCTTCHCGKQAQQATLFEIPALVAQPGTVAEYLLTHPDRVRQDHLAGILRTNRRGIRKQSQDAGGAVLFFSQTEVGGLLHIQHATRDDFRLAMAELDRRIQSLQERRAGSVALWRLMGRPL